MIEGSGNQLTPSICDHGRCRCYYACTLRRLCVRAPTIAYVLTAAGDNVFIYLKVGKVLILFLDQARKLKISINMVEI